MKILIYSWIIFIFSFYSCDKESTDNQTKDDLKNFVVIGESTANKRVLNSVLYSMCDSTSFHINLNSNNSNEFTLKMYYCLLASGYRFKIKINSNSDKYKILCDNSTQSPSILEFGDTVRYTGNWISGEMNMLNRYMSAVIGNEVSYTIGNWHDLTNKYLGLLIEYENYLILGWIQLSIHDNSIIISEIGYNKAAYNSVYNPLLVLPVRAGSIVQNRKIRHALPIVGVPRYVSSL